MAEQTKPQQKPNVAAKPEQKSAKVEEKKMETKIENKTEQKHEAKPEVKHEAKPEVKPIVKKHEAIARGAGMHASKKHCMAICRFVKGKTPDKCISYLQDVIKKKKIIHFRGEIPHRKGPGNMSGRYPIASSKQFIYLLKALKGNIVANGLDLDKSRIYFGCANWATRPQRRGGTRFKRTNVLLKAKEFSAPQRESPQRSEELHSKRELNQNKPEAKK